MGMALVYGQAVPENVVNRPQLIDAKDEKGRFFADARLRIGRNGTRMGALV
jgi:hypothetical protein